LCRFFGGDLVLQFLTESFLLNLLAFAIALGSAWLLAPSFNRLIGSEATSFTLPASYTLAFTGIFLAGSLLSGLYPAFVLSGYHPISVLKGLFKNSPRGQILRKSLITGQFAVSVILIAGTILVYQQVQYMRQQQLGLEAGRVNALFRQEFGAALNGFKNRHSDTLGLPEPVQREKNARRARGEQRIQA